MAACCSIKITSPNPICLVHTSSPRSSLICKRQFPAKFPNNNVPHIFVGSPYRIHSHQASTPSRRIVLASVSTIWNAITGGDSAREAVVAVRRGMLLFRQGDVQGSVVEFDKAIELDLPQKAYLWQRGLSLYYLDSSIVWRREARKRLLEVGIDSRPVMREAYRMFKYGGEPEKLVSAFSSGRESEYFDASLYVGLYYESEKKSDEAKHHIVAACESPYGSRFIALAETGDSVESSTNQDSSGEMNIMFLHSSKKNEI